MVRLFAVAAAALVALVSSADAAKVVNLPKGAYYRPKGSEVSGRVNATTLYERSPCPALNSMANHGLIPRDGKNLNRALLKAAVMENFNIGEDLADVMASLSPEGTFSLGFLSTHNLIEHDVSLSRRDTYFGGDQSVASAAYLLELLFTGALDGEISLKDVAKVRVARTKDCKAYNPKCDYGDQQQFIANAESGLLLRAMGAKNTEVAPYDNIYSFFVDEKFPDYFQKSKTPITFANVTATIEALKVAQA